MKTIYTKRNHGFTLVEIAIVLVIIGLLIGGILRGQELITTARVRTVISQGTSFKAAYYLFLDRYKYMPGDLTQQQATALLGSTGLGASAPSDGIITYPDGLVTLQNLAVAGLITCPTCLTVTAADGPSTPTNTLTNQFGYPMYFTNWWGKADSEGYLAPSDQPLRPILYTGYGMSFNMLSEVDRKVDEGSPAAGDFRYGFTLSLPGQSTLGKAALFASCVQTSTAAGVAGTSAAYTWSTGAGGNCSGAWVF
jgi:prepilin-type N-terminal cleavage/methylation domain-containing protein